MSVTLSPSVCRGKPGPPGPGPAGPPGWEPGDQSMAAVFVHHKYIYIYILTTFSERDEKDYVVLSISSVVGGCGLSVYAKHIQLFVEKSHYKRVLPSQV